MNYSEKAKQLFESFYCQVGGDVFYSRNRCRAVSQAIICVDEIVESLRITTGHCTLRLLDRQEVQSDFDYWDRVKKELKILKQK
jgi:hypothetical protein